MLLNHAGPFVGAGGDLARENVRQLAVRSLAHAYTMRQNKLFLFDKRAL
jgi:hypothetical protein